jgi:hypothetical protein
MVMVVLLMEDRTSGAYYPLSPTGMLAEAGIRCRRGRDQRDVALVGASYAFLRRGRSTISVARSAYSLTDMLRPGPE